MEEALNSNELILNLKCNFSDEDKEKSIPLIYKIMELASLARKCGILSLEEEVSQEKNFLLKQGIALIVDGTDPSLVKHILQNFILADNYTGFELLSRLIIMEGVLAIQGGENPRIIELKLSSLIGEKYISTVSEFITETERLQDETFNNFLKKITDNKALEESKDFESEFLKFEQSSFNIIISEVGLRKFIIALYGCSYKSITRIISGMGNNLKLMLINNWDDVKTVYKDDIISSQNHILKIIKEFKKTGRIIELQDFFNDVDMDKLQEALKNKASTVIIKEDY